MEFCVFIEPQQGASYDDQLRIARATERLGFAGFFRSDHFLGMGATDGLPGPTDSWTTLAALARETQRVRLGTLVSSATFRHPGILAIQVAQVDEMSGGRVELGLGTGWFEQEHRAYGVPFPSRRFGMLEEQLEVITGLWSTPVGSRFNHAGEHYTLVDSPALPKPAQSRVPIIIGGSGTSKTPALAARFADEYNTTFGRFDDFAPRIARAREACERAGRDPDTLRLSMPGTVAVGSTEAEAQGRAEKIGRTVEKVADGGFAGTPERVVDRIGQLRELGIRRVYFQVLDIHDLDQLELLAAEVVPQFA